MKLNKEIMNRVNRIILLILITMVYSCITATENEQDPKMDVKAELAKIEVMRTNFQ